MSVVPDFQSCDSWLPIKNADTCTCARNVIMLARARSFAGEEVWNVRWVLNVLLSLLEMILRGLCKTIYQGLRGLCIYGSNSRSSAQIVLRETPTVLSKRPHSLSMQRNVVKNYGVLELFIPIWFQIRCGKCDLQCSGLANEGLMRRSTSLVLF